jgi:hypothetical protein
MHSTFGWAIGRGSEFSGFPAEKYWGGGRPGFIARERWVARSHGGGRSLEFFAHGRRLA